MTFKSSFLPAFQAGMHWNFDTHKGIPMKIRFAFGIDRWVDHKWKESLVFDFGRYRIVLLVLKLGVILIEYL
jgi:hypothetical protein